LLGITMGALVFAGDDGAGAGAEGVVARAPFVGDGDDPNKGLAMDAAALVVAGLNRLNGEASVAPEPEAA
jgi:hypothetical protein